MGFTVGIVKPRATRHLGRILEVLTRGGFVIDEVRVLELTDEEAREFYAEHAGKPFFDEQVAFMTSEPVVFLVLSMPALDNSGELSVKTLRKLLGDTDPKKAAPFTIRCRFGSNELPDNAMHGSSDPDAAVREFKLFRRFCESRGDRSLGVLRDGESG